MPNCSGKVCGNDGCGGSCGTCGPGTACNGGACVAQGVTFSGSVYPIFVGAACDACHGGAGSGGLDLSTSAGAHAELVNVPASGCTGATRVVPGNPGASYLVSKLTGVGICSGARMPQGGPYLSQAELDTIVAWIAAGAPNN